MRMLRRWRPSHVRANYVVIATGYDRALPEYLAPVREFLAIEGEGKPKLRRDYRVEAADDFLPAIYLPGFGEHSHGIGDTLLSLAAYRAGIRDSLLANPPCEDAFDPVRAW